MTPVHLVAALCLAALAGLSMGMVGAGGAIIMVPILVYVARVPPHDAIPTSLAVVGATSLVGGLAQWRKGNADLRAFAIYAATGMVGAALGARFTRMVPEAVLMTAFGALLAVVSYRMAFGPQAGEEDAPGACRPALCAVSGFGVGVLTGFLGVGGGFLIVPALMAFARMPMRLAVGTSLLTIAANSAAGLASHARAGHSPGHETLMFVAAAVAGLAIGTVLGGKMRPSALKAVFAALCAVIALLMLGANLPLLAGRR